MLDAAIRLVVGNESDAELSHALRAANDPLAGFVYCVVTAQYANVSRLQIDLLKSLGKTDRLLANRVVTRQGRTELVCAWLVAERIDTLVIGHAYGLRADGWESAATWATAAGAHLWVVSGENRVRRGQRDLAKRLNMEIASADDLLSELAGRDAVKAPVATTPGFPPVPNDDFPTFIAACKSLLSGDDFERVAARYAQAVHETAAALRGFKEVPPADAAALLRTLTESCSSAYEALVVVRGAASLLFLADLLVAVDLPVFYSVKGPGRSTLDRSVARLLRAYSRPRTSSLAVMALLVPGGEVHRLLQVDIDDVDPNGYRVRVGDRLVAIPDEAQGIIRAQRLLRLSQQDRLDDSFFAAHTPHPGFPRMDMTKFAIELRGVSRDTGLMFSDSPGTSQGESAEEWTRRVGVNVRRLWPEAPRGAWRARGVSTHA